MLLRGLISAICLLPPTILMGASLPAIVRWVESTPRGVSWWGLLYGGNTVGAVFGCLLAGFYLLRVYDTAVATFAAVAINWRWRLVSFCAGREVAEPAALACEEPRQERRGGSVAADEPASRVAGVCDDRPFGRLRAGRGSGVDAADGHAAGRHGIRVLDHPGGVSDRAGAGQRRPDRWLLRWPKLRNARLALGWCQMLLTRGDRLDRVHDRRFPALLADQPAADDQPLVHLPARLVRCLWAILPADAAVGREFPAGAGGGPGAGPGEDPGRVVGGIYAANTLGAIVGALAVSLVLMPWIGTQDPSACCCCAIGGERVVACWRRTLGDRPAAAGLAASGWWRGCWPGSVDAVPGELIAYGRRMAVITRAIRRSSIRGRGAQFLGRDLAAGTTARPRSTSTATWKPPPSPYDMKLQRMVGHLPALLHPNPKSVLGIGFGAGVSAGTFTRYPGIEKITVCEIEPVIPPTSTRYFRRARLRRVAQSATRTSCSTTRGITC